MKKGKGSGMILVGGILEGILAIASIIVIILYLSNNNIDFIKQLGLAPGGSIKAMIGFYGLGLLHIIAVIAAIISSKKVKHYMPALIIGFLLMLLCNIFTDWSTAGAVTIGLNLLPGALLAGGGFANRMDLKDKNNK